MQLNQDWVYPLAFPSPLRPGSIPPSPIPQQSSLMEFIVVKLFLPCRIAQRKWLITLECVTTSHGYIHSKKDNWDRQCLTQQNVSSKMEYWALTLTWEIDYIIQMINCFFGIKFPVLQISCLYPLCTLNPKYKQYDRLTKWPKLLPLPSRDRVYFITS